MQLKMWCIWCLTFASLVLHWNYELNVAHGSLCSPSSTVLTACLNHHTLATNSVKLLSNQAIRPECSRALFCISLSAVCNAIGGSGATVQHSSSQCCGCTLPGYPPSWNPERESDWPRYELYFTHFTQLYELLGITLFCNSVYHPQTDRLIKRFNQTLK